MPEAPESALKTVCLDIASCSALERAVVLLREGDPVAFPTDTVYGIGVHGFRPSAVEQLYQLKRRPSYLPIPLLLPDLAAMQSVCVDIPPIAWNLAARFWPGALSLILRRAPTVPDVVTSGGETVAVRVPDHSRVRDLCRVLAAPLAATSANQHGEQPPNTAEGVKSAFGGRIPLILDGGTCQGGMASTVLDLTVTPPAILRQGPISARQLVEIGGLWDG
jgi:L-threonylcarbamoyladenylate synthase